MTNEELIKINQELRETITEMREKISAMRDVLRFCARPDVGTYYQQQSARKMLIDNIQIVWSDYNPDGTHTEEYKQGIRKRFDEAIAKEILDRIDEIEAELLP